MKAFSLRLAVCVSSLVAIASAGLRADEIKQVEVVNTPLPVAAQGTTTVAGTIGLVPGTVVALAPVEPFLKTIKLQFPANSIVSDAGTIANVPAGKQLVLEYVSGQFDAGVLQGSGFLDFILGVPGAPEVVEPFVPVAPPAVGPFNSLIVSQPIRLVLPPQTTAQVRLFSAAPTQVFANEFRVVLSGHFESAP